MILRKETWSWKECRRKDCLKNLFPYLSKHTMNRTNGRKVSQRQWVTLVQCSFYLSTEFVCIRLNSLFRPQFTLALMKETTEATSLQIEYVPFPDAFGRAQQEHKLVHSVVLWGSLDDQSCWGSGRVLRETALADPAVTNTLARNFISTWGLIIDLQVRRSTRTSVHVAVVGRMKYWSGN